METKSIDERFDEVAHAFVEQRDFIDNRLGRVEHRLDRHELVLSEILNEVKALRSRPG